MSDRTGIVALALGVCAAIVLGGSLLSAGERDSAAKLDPAVERTRETVKMLDDVYKTAIVLITENYVEDENDFPAGSAAIAWFGAIKEKGWHEVRLVDAAGEPINSDNSPRDDFERGAVKQLKSGAAYYEQVVDNGGKRYLRAATPIPVVLEKCTMCHENYKQAAAGEPIGILSYTIEIK